MAQSSGSGLGGPSNPLRSGFDAANAALTSAADEALKSAGLHSHDVSGICAGLAGASQRNVVKRVLVFLAREFPRAVAQVTTDYEIALEAAVGAGPGVVLIAGTGSSAYGRNAEGLTARAGGYGPWIGDEGSAFEIGRRAVAAVARTRDNAALPTLLSEMIPSAVHCSDWDELMQRIMKTPDDVFPALFPVVAQAAEIEDSAAKEDSVYGGDQSRKPGHDRDAPPGHERKRICFGEMRRGVRTQPNAGFACRFRSRQRRSARERFAAHDFSCCGSGENCYAHGSNSCGRSRQCRLKKRCALDDARIVPAEPIADLLSSTNEENLRALIANAALDETQLCLLLDRKDLSATVLDEIAKQKQWRANYRVRYALAAHPHTPRLIAMRLLRDLHLMDLVWISLLPASPVELRRLAEERVLTQLPQLPLGQRIMLARRGSARVAGGLIAEGPLQVARIALDNAFLTESQLLKLLAKDSLGERIVAAIANHEKWSKLMNVRIALLRHGHSPVDRILSFIPDLALQDIQDLLGLSTLSARVRSGLASELARR